ncbi:MAG TPA: HAD family hydrolase [Roseiarcus sp.]|jgi:phosphoglycolate phosphatase-like HAD superfamily hydrolase
MALRRREFTALLLGGAAALSLAGQAEADSDPLPSWSEGPAKDAIVKFVRATTDAASPEFVPVVERIATFDQDGTLWVEQPIYTQVVFAFSRVPEVVKERPELADEPAFKAVLSGDRELIASLSVEGLLSVVGATLTGMDVEVYRDEVAAWLKEARDPRWKRPFTELVYQPQIELLKYLRAHGYRTYIVTGGGQDFVRAYSEPIYGIPVEQVVGTMFELNFEPGAEGKPILKREPKLLLNDDKGGKPEGIHLVIGRRPHFAFGNTPGDQQMLQYTTAGAGARLGMLVLHDDGAREYAYGPARGLPDSKIGTFPQSLYDLATKEGWFVVSMKNDWKRIFAFE